MFKIVRRCKGLLLSLLFLTSLIVSIELGSQKALSYTNEQLVQAGLEQYNSGNYSGAIATWKNALSVYEDNQELNHAAIVTENIALAYRQLGDTEKGIDYWQKTINYYQQLQETKTLGRLLVELAQSYNNLGSPYQSLEILCGSQTECLPKTALAIAREYQDKTTEAAALGVLGDTYRLINQYPTAIAYLEESVKISEKFSDRTYYMAGLNSLGNVYLNLAKINYYRSDLAKERGDQKEQEKLTEKAREYDDLARKKWEESLNIAETMPKQPNFNTDILLNSLEPLYRNNSADFSPRLEEAIAIVAQTPDSRTKVYQTIELANLLQAESQINPRKSTYQCLAQQNPQSEKLLKQALTIAQTLEDNRSLSLAYGRLGHYYECENQLEKATELTQKAIVSAEQDLKNQDILYLWEWQLGRLLKAENQQQQAIKSYERSIKIVEQIKGNLLAANQELELNFRTNIEPIYRGLASLRIEDTLISSSDPNSLNQVISTIDALKIVELQNYLGSDCIFDYSQNYDINQFQNRQNIAVIYTIIFPEYLSVIADFPQGDKKSILIKIDKNQLIQEVNEFRRGLERYRDFTYDTKMAQELYNWIVAPFAEELEKSGVTNLVFINDGILRSIPMSVLHDGEKFLVEKYAITISPGLSLTRIASPSEERDVLAVGVSKSVTVDGQTFPPLNNVTLEINEIKTRIPTTTSLIDENFSLSTLEQQVNQTPYNTIHIATHGQFSSEPEKTFLVTGDNNKITMSDLQKVLSNLTEDQSIDLLALTACQTAVGDERAALGLAGISVESGVETVFASLWFIQDSSTAQLVVQFYDNIQSGLNKSESLRLAQQEMISQGGVYAHPAYWAPFIILGDWT